jgi:predicted ester cyclase
MNRIAATAAIATMSAFAIAGTSEAAENLPQPHHLASGTDSSSAVLAARRYAAFWDTGDESYAHAALSADFRDRTLPVGRPQGPTGPLAASNAFRTAVPDLRAEIDEMVVAGDRVSVHLHFHGHFSGQFGTVQGQGQPIDFQAFDLYRVEGGRIVENWHLEDNLSLMQQFGVIAR